MNARSAASQKMDCEKMTVTTKFFETQLKQIQLNPRKTMQLGFQIF